MDPDLLLASRGALALLAATCAASLYVLLVDGRAAEGLLLHPWSVARGKRPWTLLTSGFLHADLWHLAFNMVTFYYFGFLLETRMGTGPFLLLYLAALVLSDVPSVLRHRDDPGYRSLGASGAVSGVLFAFILHWPDASIYFLFVPFPIPAPLYGAAFLSLSWYAARHRADGINHEAHFWGAVVGGVLAALLDPEAARTFADRVRAAYFGVG